MRARGVLRPRDLLWLLAYPVYQVLGTIRHEGGHAMGAKLEGATIREFVFLPRVDERRGLLWGYVAWDGEAGWLATAAPYLVALLAFAVLFPLCMRLRGPRWLWLNLVVLGVVSPLVDTAYAYQGGFWRPQADVAVLLVQVPPWTVHVAFTAAITTYLVALVALLRTSRFARLARTPESASA